MSSSTSACLVDQARWVEIRDAEENQRLVAKTWRRIKRTETLHLSRHQLDFLFALTYRRVLSGITAFNPARRQLPEDTIDAGAILANQNHLTGVVDRKSGRPTGMLTVGLRVRGVRQSLALNFDREHSAS